MGIDLLRGRGFTDGDNERSRDVAVISDGMAKKYWPNEDPFGHTFRLGSEKARKIEVVGIARDVEFSPIRGDKSQPPFYLPYPHHVKENSFIPLQLKTQEDPLALAPPPHKRTLPLSPSPHL